MTKQTAQAQPAVALHRQRVVVVRECLWHLVGEDFHAAAILGQMTYWTLRTRDIDEYLCEEAERMAQEGRTANVGPTCGWIYKSAEELSEELLGLCSRQTVARRLDDLVEAGLIERRHNPDHKWDRTLQYRPNLEAIEQGLRELSYSLENAFRSEDWKLVRKHLDPDKCIGQGEKCISHPEQSSAHSEQMSAHPEQSNARSEQSSAHSEQAIPETIPKTIAEPTTKTTPPPGGGGHNQCIKEVIVEHQLPIHDNFIPGLAKLAQDFDDDAQRQGGTGLSWLLDAMTEVDATVKNPVRYVRAILKRWRSRGYDGPYKYTSQATPELGVRSMEPDPELEPLWQGVLEELRLEMTKATFETWLRDTHAVGESDGALVVMVRNEYARDWLENRLSKAIQRVLRRQREAFVTVRLVTPEESDGIEV